MYVTVSCSNNKIDFQEKFVIAYQVVLLSSCIKLKKTNGYKIGRVVFT